MTTARKNTSVDGSKKTVAQPLSPYAIELAELLADGPPKPIETLELGDLTIDVVEGRTSLWALIRRPERGGLALRLAFVTTSYSVHKCSRQGAALRLELRSRSGRHDIALRTMDQHLQKLRATVSFTPAFDVLVPFLPRDLYPLGEDDALAAVGGVEAAQRGLNSGLLYFHIDQPSFGSVLYFQNLTDLNGYFSATNTAPDGAVGGEWPELGYQPPAKPLRGARAAPLRQGVTVTLSDALLVFRDDSAPSEEESARRFLQMLGSVYTSLDLPRPAYHDWVERSQRTLDDLDTSTAATVRHYGHRYIHPYTAAEYPDIMVQMSLIAAIHDWGRWLGKPHALESQLKAGLEKFFDPALGSLRRYLPNVGKDKDADAVDSWYLYHPMLNLARLALGGDEQSRDLFLRSVEFGIKAARHFDYRWPIHYKVTDFSVITATANDGRGQTDVGGLYAYVMLQAYELTDEPRFLKEARAAIDAAADMRFNLNYQANLTAWGAAACVRLWRITNLVDYLNRSYVYLASFFHNCAIWESQIGFAANYTNFLGVTCLQDAPYMALYECFDSFTAFDNYLEDSGPAVEPAVRMLLTEYCKYALDRAWFYYPSALPPEALAADNRNGYIDRNLAFPVEDLYVDGQAAGQVGQEIYGAGAAMVFASRMYLDVDGAPFLLFCNHFIRSQERVGERTLNLQVDGGDACVAALSLIARQSQALPKATVHTATGDAVRPQLKEQSRLEFLIPANGHVTLSWSDNGL